VKKEEGGLSWQGSFFFYIAIDNKESSTREEISFTFSWDRVAKECFAESGTGWLDHSLF
jgi:hypothetical protein